VYKDKLRPRAFARRLRRIVVSGLTVLGFVVILVTITPLDRWWAFRLADPWTDAKGDTLIVLSGSNNDPVIGYSTYLRCQYAVLAWREGGFRKVIVSGGPEGHSLAAMMKQFMISQGVPEGAIVEEEKSTSTRENALFSKEVITPADGRLVLMTSDYHMFRAARVFKKVGVSVSTRPIPDAAKRGSSWQGRWPAFLDLCTETIKIAYYRARGWM
jgi:uncharacterized SAM-binding protein YcdF (DUF218 family)